MSFLLFNMRIMGILNGNNGLTRARARPSAQGVSYTHAIHVYACAVL